MAQTVIEPKISEIPDVDIHAEIPCGQPLGKSCPNPARWVWYLDCGATGRPICDEHNADFAKVVRAHLDKECLCIPYEHTHLTSEIKNRRL